MEKNKITRLAFILVFVSFLLSTFISLWSLSVMAQNNRKELSRMITARIYDTIIGELSEPVVISKTMANDRFLIDALANEGALSEEKNVGQMSEYLANIKERLGYESAFVISEASRRYYSFNGLNKVIDPENDEFDTWYTDFVATGKPYEIDVDSDEVTDSAWTVFINTRIESSDGQLLGVCGVGRHMTKSRELFYSLEKKYNVDITLVDTDGLVQVDTEEATIQKERLDQAITGNIDSEEYVYRKLGRRQYAVTKYIDSLDWYLVVRSDGSNEVPQFVNVILLNVVLCLFVMALLIIATRIIMLRTIALTNASFKDQATMLYNRRAFEEEKARLAEEDLDKDFVYVTIDVNGLKTVNDNLGHVAGDELIKGAADCLRQVFSKDGKVFRIGGDEFAALITVSENRLRQLKADLEKAVSDWKGEHADKLSISCGYASRREFPSENISELARISDERMYEDKAEHYRKLGTPRRGKK